MGARTSSLVVIAVLGMALLVPAPALSQSGIASRPLPDVCKTRQRQGAIFGALAGAILGGLAAGDNSEGEGAVVGALLGAAVGSQAAKGLSACGRELARQAAEESARTGEAQTVRAEDGRTIVAAPAQQTYVEAGKTCMDVTLVIGNPDGTTADQQPGPVRTCKTATDAWAAESLAQG